jgi:hypothetical protein
MEQPMKKLNIRVVEPMKTHFQSLLKKKSMGLNSRFSHLTSTATPFKHLHFSRNGIERSSIESKNKGIAVIFYSGILNSNPSKNI